MALQDAGGQVAYARRPPIWAMSTGLLGSLRRPGAAVHRLQQYRKSFTQRAASCFRSVSLIEPARSDSMVSPSMRVPVEEGGQEVPTPPG